MAKPIPNTQTGSLIDNQHGTNDVLTAPGTPFSYYGDAYKMHNNSHGGNDTLTGSSTTAFNILSGDTQQMHNYSVGGNDTLIGGAGAA